MVKALTDPLCDRELAIQLAQRAGHLPKSPPCLTRRAFFIGFSAWKTWEKTNGFEPKALFKPLKFDAQDN